MNFLKQAYAAGADAAKLAFQALPPPKPGRNQVNAKNTATRASTTVTQTAPATGSATAAGPAATTSENMTLGGNKPPISAPALASNSAVDVARAAAGAGQVNIMAERGVGTSVPAGATAKAAPYASTGSAGATPGAPLPAKAISTTVTSGSKAAEFNMGMTPDPLSSPDKVPSPDNGRRMYGTQFSDALRPLRDVDQAFNALNIQKNTDVLNSAGQAEFGAPRG